MKKTFVTAMDKNAILERQVRCKKRLPRWLGEFDGSGVDEQCRSKFGSSLLFARRWYHAGLFCSRACEKGLGQSTVVHVGGDLLMGTTYADLLRLFEKDDQTKAVAIFGEHGGSYEFEIVDMIRNNEYTKPLAIYIGGKFANTLPEGMNIGHAGAIVERGKGAAEKEAALKEVGVMIAETYEELVSLVKPFA